MKMKCVVLGAAIAAVPMVASGQTSIPMMTVPAVQVDFESMPTGGTGVAQINAAHPGANFLDIQPIGVDPLLGNYSTGFNLGRALGLDPAGSGRLFIVDPGEDFGSSNGYSFSLGTVSTQVGLSIADFNGTKDVMFYSGANLVGQTTVDGGGGPVVQFWELNTPFDRVEITGAPNYVVPELWVQAIPAPGSVALLGLGGLVLARRRR